MWLQYLFVCVLVAACKGSCSSEAEEIVPASERNFYVSYFLYSPEHQVREIVSSEELAAEYLNVEKNTTIIVHGHRGHHEDSFSNNVRRAFTDHHDCDVFVMNWAFLAGDNYLQVVRNVPQAADDLAVMLVKINEAKPDQAIHIVGFGIGAHLAGNAGTRVGARFPVDRITGLDPTGKFYSGSNTLRLSRADANYVEVIHTDGGLFGNGIGTAIGHSDFFVNGGYSQPGCLTNSCCHRRAWELFVASLHPQFIHLGHRCDSMIQVNLNTCRGLTLNLGDAVIDKGVPTPDVSTLYRANTGRIYPFV